MKFEADLPHCVKTCEDIITCAGSGLHLRPDRIVRINKEIAGLVASGTHCIN